jgi:cardiolipin synthase A/B
MKRSVFLLWAVCGCGTDLLIGPPGGGNDGGGGVVSTPDLAEPSPNGMHCDATDPRTAAPDVAVLPDAGEAPYVSVLSRAQHTIDLMVYEMGFGGIYDTLKTKAAAGVTVRVILDQGTTSNQKYYDMLAAAGVQVKWSNPVFPYMHAKVFVVDGAEAVLSTGNYSLVYSIQRERNYVMHLTDAEDVADVAELIAADWDMRSPNLSCTRLIVSPINSRDRILALIASATQTLDIESMQFADTDVRAAVADRVSHGVQVRALLAAPSWITANADAATFLQNMGVPVRYMSTPGVHVKAFTVDGKTAYAGSENFSYTSLSKNREVGAFLTESSSVAPIKSTFETDWAASTAF